MLTVKAQCYCHHIGSHITTSARVLDFLKTITAESRSAYKHGIAVVQTRTDYVACDRVFAFIDNC